MEIAQAVRTIDDTPTRTELIQYERRFVELYQQVAWKLEETRKYYDMYNTLDTTLGFLQKEVRSTHSSCDHSSCEHSSCEHSSCGHSSLLS